jgi:hypothetical protein
VLHSVIEGEAWKGFVVACFDCCKPGGQDWVTSGSMVETDERADAGRSYLMVAWGDEVGGGKAWG